MSSLIIDIDSRLRPKNIWILNPMRLKMVKISLLSSWLMKMHQLSLMKTIMKVKKCKIKVMEIFLRHYNHPSSLLTHIPELDFYLNLATVLKQILKTCMICKLQTKLIRPRHSNSNKVVETVCFLWNLPFLLSKVV